MTDVPIRDGGSRPVPDPTLLTTEQLIRGLRDLRELIESKLDEQHTLMDGHFIIDNERFAKISEQLSSVERVRVEQKADTKRELDAALTAQKESSTKTEAALIKLLDSITTTFNTGMAALTGRLDDVRDRVVAIESNKAGASEQRTESRQSTSLTAAMIGLSVTVIIGLLAVIGFMSAHLK